MRKVKLNRMLALGLLFIFLAFMTGIAYDTYNKMQVVYYDTYGIVGENPGFDTSGERLGFGKITQGGSSKRKVIINNGEYEKEGYVYVKGDISPMVSVKDSPFNLKPYENKTLVFLMSAPLEQSLGLYRGEVRIVLKGKR